MSFSFTKMHCNGNDYIVLETFTQEIYDLFTLSLILPDRRCGIGADALIEVAPSEEADAEVRVYSQDGTDSDMAGCAVRCAVKLLRDQKICEKDRYRLKMTHGIVEAEPVSFKRRSVSAVCESIPMPKIEEKGSVAVEARDKHYRLYPVERMGQHCVLFADENFADVEGIENVNLAAVAAALNSLPEWKKSSVQLMEPSGDGGWKMRMWIPGHGEARANALGVAAGVMAMARRGLALPHEDVRVAVQGGEMVFHVKNGVLFLTGTVQDVFDGVSQF